MMYLKSSIFFSQRLELNSDLKFPLLLTEHTNDFAHTKCSHKKYVYFNEKLKNKI